MANDGQEQTWWRACRRGPAFWAMDLENVYDIRSVSLSIPDESGPGFVLEVSSDSADWHPVAEAEGGRRAYDFASFAQPVSARFVRIRFPSVAPGHPAMLSEVRVMAVPAH